MDNLSVDILDQACQWQARMHAHDCSEQDRVLCREWLQIDPEHAGAFALAGAMHTSVGLMGQEEAELQALADEAYALGTGDVRLGDPAPAISLARYRADQTEEERRSVNTRRNRGMLLQQMLSVAAAICVVCLATFYLLSVEQPYMQEHFTAGQEPRTLKLDDGSIVSLDAGAAISVVQDPNARIVMLQQGRAFFDVAHDKSRPFKVITENSEVIAVGTSFQVESTSSGSVEVILSSGIVDVIGRYPDGERTERLQPGEKLALNGSASGSWVKGPVDTVSAISWINGRHVFRDTPLASAIQSINRYARVKISLGDPQLSELRISGNFVRGDSELAVSAITAAFPLRSIETDNEIILFPEYRETR